MKYKIFLFIGIFVFTSFIESPNVSERKRIVDNKVEKTDSNTENLYHQLLEYNNDLPSFECFQLAISGYEKWKLKGYIEKEIITIIDFSRSSNTKRLWVIDLKTHNILFNTLVAHGRNTGEEFARMFSNKAESFQSSLGFFATAELYQGKHGLSLRLDGLQKGLNDNARERAVVMHGADYVSESFIKNNKRLGRSLGCPALPVELNQQIVETIQDKSCVFIYHPSLKNKFI